jgi:hypothetical protein
MRGIFSRRIGHKLQFVLLPELQNLLKSDINTLL